MKTKEDVLKKTKKKSVREILNTKVAKYIVGTLLFTGIGITLPRIFHMLAGSAAGAKFLPMHIAVFIASLVFGSISGMIVGAGSIIFSYILTGMPNLVRFPYMLIELLIYAILLGAFRKKYDKFTSVFGTIIFGRVIYAAILYIATNTIGFSSYGISVVESFKIGIPGIVFQLLFIPIIAKLVSGRLSLKND